MAAMDTNDAFGAISSGSAQDADPFNATPRARSSGHRYSSFDSNLFSSYSEASPSQAKMTLEAHIADTDRRIHEASRLGTSLLEQKKQLANHLKDVEQRQGSTEIGPELRQKLTDLEKEYNDLGRESARAFIPKSRKPSANPDDALRSLDRTPSPTKLAAPTNASSRKQRNSSNRVEDLAFATEISTSLLSQLRHLQNVLAEKEEALRDATAQNTKLLADADNANFKLRNLDDNEQRYKDENWRLETQAQDLAAQLKDSALREQKLSLALSASKEEMTASERECDDLKASHTKLNEEHATLRKKHDAETAGLRRSVASAETDKESLHKKIAELTSQNEDLAKAVAYRINADRTSKDTDAFLVDDDADLANISPDHSPPPSPTKGTPRHGALESETLKSSLHHAHRMIQNLKSNIHREKTEKLELRRMLQEARDELEARRADGGPTAANAGKRRKPTSQNDLFKKPARPDKLGGAKSTTEEIVEDPSWEEYDDNSPSKARGLDKRASIAFSTTDQSEGFETANEREANATDTDGFETANERDSNAAETDAFETAGSVVADDTDGDLTETEATQSPTKAPVPLQARGSGIRSSYQSTASDDGDLAELRTTPRSQQPSRYKLRLNRAFVRAASETPSAKDSPASFVSDRSTPAAGQNLAAELEDLGDDTSVADSTPSRSIVSPMSSPEAQTKRSTVIRASPVSQPSKPEMVDSGTMTDMPEPADAVSNIPATASFDNSNLPNEGVTDEAGPTAREIEPNTSSNSEPVQLQMSPIKTQQTEPVAPKLPQPEPREPLFEDAVRAAAAPVGLGLVSEIMNGTPAKNSDKATPFDSERGVENSQPEIVHEIPQDPTPQTSQAADQTKRVPFQPVSGNASMPKASPSTPVKNEGTQTTVSSDQIDTLIKERNRKATLQPSPSPLKPTNTGRAMSMGAKSADQLALLEFPSPGPKSPKRPGSAGSLRKGATSPQFDAPPLPTDHKQVIAAASKAPTATSAMPPPALPASALRTSQQLRPRTPTGSIIHHSSSRYSTSNSRNRAPSVAARSEATRRSSVSSFASELDERFDASHVGNVYSNQGFDMGTDPRMIQAITQTMIGEFMYKYTRKAGRGDMSENRHRRFFWIHPYTRTLYWSTHDPSRANRSELKAKSVPIEAVRVISDDNPNPPGLHPKSIVIVTPSRSIKFTAPTSHRHETWFNALSYLLLRNTPAERRVAVNQQARHYNDTNPATSIHERSNTMSSITSEDLSEFNPGSQNRSTSHMTAGSQNFSYRPYAASTSGARAAASVKRASTASLASRNVSTLVPTLTTRQSYVAAPAGGIPEPLQSSSVEQGQIQEKGTPTPVRITVAAQASSPAKSGRLSSLSNRLSRQSFFRRSRSSMQLSNSPFETTPVSTPSKATPGRSKSLLGSITAAQPPAGPSEHDHVHAEQSGDGSSAAMENVRACCDGKHDVGSLLHTHQRGSSMNRSHASLSSRVSGAFA